MDRHKSFLAATPGHIVDIPQAPARQSDTNTGTKPENDCSEVQHTVESRNLEFPHSNSPFLTKSKCAPEVERQSLSEYIDRHFHNYDRAHGAIESRVLIWGCEGDGKRQFASRYADEFVSTRRRQILWIEAGLSHTFIRDFRLAYQIMTKEMPPTGTNLASLLYIIQTTLSECCEKWFMVILDLGGHLSRPTTNESGFDLTSYLPKGQILITHSTGLYSRHTGKWQERVCPDLELQSLSASIQWSSVSYDNASKYINKVFPSVNTHAEMTKKTLRGLEDHFITMIVACATSFLQRISISRYCRLLDRTMTELQHGVTTMPFHHLPYFKFSVAMELLMDTLRNVNRLAGTLLAMMPVVSHRDVPVQLVVNLPPFRRRPDELEDVLELLNSCCIITLRTTPNGERFIDMNPMVHAWLDKKAREQFWDGDSDFVIIVLDWIDTIDAALPEVIDDDNGYQYWSLLHLVVPLLEVSRESDIRAQALLSLLRKTCTFLGEHLIMPVISGQLLARAQELCTVLGDRLENNQGQAIVLHRERSKMLFLLGNSVLAQDAMRAAQKLLDTAKLDDGEKDVLQESVFDERNSQLLQQNRTREAARWLRRAFMEGSAQISEARHAKLHHWLACTASHDLEANIYALQHSHIAMCYWSKLTESQKWGFEHFPQLAWADTHAGFLMQLDKSRGALVFLPEIFKRHIEQCPPYHENIWRLAFCLVREYSFVFEYKAAEQIAYQALSRADHKLLRGAPLTWAIMMMRGLADTFYRDGKYLEAEGIFRWCLDCLENRNPPAILGQSGTMFSCLPIWGELVQVLLVQGKVQEAHAARELSVQRGYEVLKDKTWVALREPHDDLSRQYDRALQAAQDRMDNLHNAEDWMLDLGRPGSFYLPVRLFGDPFERLQNGNKDFRADLYPSQNYCMFKNSKILPLIGYLDGDVPLDESKPDAIQTSTLWDKVFQSRLSTCVAHNQTQLSEYFRWCGCRKRRTRAFSSGSRTMWSVEDDTVKEDRSRLDGRGCYQALITEYFRGPTTYPTVACDKDCPCIRANIDGKIVSDQIASEKLFMYEISEPEARELEHQYYLEDLARYRRQYGPRPALPYGFGVYSNWRIPEYVTEANGDALLQHELFWAPDFVLRGDAASSSEFYGQEENYLMTNPALMTVDDTGIPVFDLPNIRVTAHKLGEKVKANVDRLTNRWRLDWVQPKITRYFKYIEPRKQDGGRRRLSSVITEDSLSLSIVTGRESNRHRRVHKVQSGSKANTFSDKKRRTTSTSPGAGSDTLEIISGAVIKIKKMTSEFQQGPGSPPDYELSPSRSRSRSPYDGRTRTDNRSRSSSTSSCLNDNNSHVGFRTTRIKPKKLHVFSINSIHSDGSIFDPGIFSKRKLNRMRAVMVRHAGRVVDSDSDIISNFSSDSAAAQDDEFQDEYCRARSVSLHDNMEINHNFIGPLLDKVEPVSLLYHTPHSLENAEGEDELNNEALSVNPPGPAVQDATTSHDQSAFADTTEDLVCTGKGKGKAREQE